MDQTLERRLGAIAEQSELTLGESFVPRLNQYTQQFFSELTSADQRTIHIFLADAAFRIAQLEGKRTVDADDVKSAIWLYHVPERPNDPCHVAGNTILERKGNFTFRRQLAPNFRRILEGYEGPGTATESNF